jgi:transcriptional regulator with XRE-family HTH domain
MFGLRIADARAAAGLTQRDVAEAMTSIGAPTTAQAVSHWEIGKWSPGVKRRVAIAQVLGVAADDLFALPNDEAVA